MNGPSSFGIRTEGYAAALAGLPVFVVAPGSLGRAYFPIAEARRAGDEFAALFLLGDRRGEYAYELANHIVATESTYDRQRAFFDGIAEGGLEVAGQTVLQRSAFDPRVVGCLTDLMHIPDVIVVRSWLEWQRQRALTLYSRANVARWYPARNLGAWSPAARRDLVVVWAPEYPAELTAIHTFALHNLHEEVVVVCNGGTGRSERCRYLDVASPEAALALGRAACVVDTTLDDPSWTQALAERGLSVAAAATGGAHEVADGIALYDPWSHKTIWAATIEALGRKASVARESPPSNETIIRALELTHPAAPTRNPLVSIVVPTYNRRNDLARCLRALKAQTYTNIEVVVVNDGGASVTGIDDDPRIRWIELESNVGALGAINRGMREARGEYVQIVADDDELYRDHVMRLVGALERTGAGVAHSNVLIRYEAPASDGRFVTTGYNASVFCLPLDRIEVYYASPVAGQALMMRRELLERVGLFDEECILADQEMQFRLSQISEFIHVPHVTAEWLVRDGGDQYFRKKAKDVVGDMRRIFERYPVEGRPYILSAREQTLEKVAARPPGFVFPPIVSRAPEGSSS